MHPQDECLVWVKSHRNAQHIEQARSLSVTRVSQDKIGQKVYSAIFILPGIARWMHALRLAATLPRGWAQPWLR